MSIGLAKPRWWVQLVRYAVPRTRGGSAVSPLNTREFSSETTSTSELASLASEHPEGVQLKVNGEVIGVLMSLEHFHALEGLAWLAEDPKRYREIAELHDRARHRNDHSDWLSFD
jgi:hypothetical protein